MDNGGQAETKTVQSQEACPSKVRTFRTLMISRRCLTVSLFFSLESVMTINQQSFLVSNMCDEFRGVCGPLKVFPPFFRCEAIKKENPATVLCDPFQIDIYLQQEESPFCVAKPLQVRMELATEIVLCFPSPLCCQSPSLCRMEDGKRWKRWGPASKTQMTTIHMATFCRRGWVM